MKHLLSAILVVILMSSLAIAQGNFGKEGVLEFSGTVGFMSATPVANGTTGSATSTIMLEPSIGYFVTEGVEVGVNPLSFQSISPPVGSSESMLGFWGFGAYHFMTMGTTYPYIEALIGYTSISAGSTAGGLAYGGAAGAKFEITNGLLLDASAQYRFYTYTPSGASSRSGMNVLSIGVGLSGFITP